MRSWPQRRCYVQCSMWCGMHLAIRDHSTTTIQAHGSRSAKSHNNCVHLSPNMSVTIKATPGFQHHVGPLRARVTLGTAQVTDIVLPRSVVPSHSHRVYQFGVRPNPLLVVATINGGITIPRASATAATIRSIACSYDSRFCTDRRMLQQLIRCLSPYPVPVLLFPIATR